MHDWNWSVHQRGFNNKKHKTLTQCFALVVLNHSKLKWHNKLKANNWPNQGRCRWMDQIDDWHDKTLAKWFIVLMCLVQWGKCVINNRHATLLSLSPFPFPFPIPAIFHFLLGAQENRFCWALLFSSKCCNSCSSIPSLGGGGRARFSSQFSVVSMCIKSIIVSTFVMVSLNLTSQSLYLCVLGVLAPLNLLFHNLQ